MKPVHGTRTGWRTDDSRLPDWLKLQIQRQKTGPWCDVCGNSMSAQARARGELSHPCCDRFETPALEGNA